MLKRVFIVGTIAFAPLFALAASVHFGDYFLKGSQNAPDDVYALGETAIFAGTVEGDAFAAGRSVFSQGDISGDALFLGETLRVGGALGDDARLIGGIVAIDGRVSDDVIAIGSRIIIGPEAHISGTLYAIGGEVEIHGKVLSGAQVYAGELLLSGTVEGDLELWGKGTFQSSARIGGDFIQHVSGKATAPLNVTIGGKVIFDDAERDGMAFSGSLFGGLFSLKVLMMLSLGFALLFLVRERAEEVLLDALPNFWMRALRGLLILVILPATIALLMLTVVGIPVALVLASLLLALFLLSFACAGILFGAWLEQFFFKRSAFPLSYRPVLLGSIGVSVISILPFVGPVIYGILFLAAAGSIGTVFFRKLRARM